MIFGMVPRENICIQTVDTNVSTNQMIIYFDSVLPDKPVFVKYKFDSLNKVLLYNNSLYESYLSLHTTNAGLMTGDSCPGGIYSGVITGMEIPNYARTGSVIRWYPNLFDEKDFPHFCFPTEKFHQHNFLREFIYKFYPDSTTGYVKFSSASFDQVWSVCPVTSITTSDKLPNGHFVYILINAAMVIIFCFFMVIMIIHLRIISFMLMFILPRIHFQ